MISDDTLISKLFLFQKTAYSEVEGLSKPVKKLVGIAKDTAIYFDGDFDDIVRYNPMDMVRVISNNHMDILEDIEAAENVICAPDEVVSSDKVEEDTKEGDHEEAKCHEVEPLEKAKVDGPSDNAMEVEGTNDRDDLEPLESAQESEQQTIETLANYRKMFDSDTISDFFHDFQMNPSGTYVQFDAKAIGSGSEGAEQSLQEVYQGEIPRERGFQVSTRIWDETGTGNGVRVEVTIDGEEMVNETPHMPCRGGNSYDVYDEAHAMIRLVAEQRPCRGGNSCDVYDDGYYTDDYGYADSKEEDGYDEYYGNDVYYDGYHTDDYGYAEDYHSGEEAHYKAYVQAMAGGFDFQRNMQKI